MSKQVWLKTKCLRWTLGTLCAFAMLCAGQSASAVLIASEDFVYPDGALSGNNGGTGWGGAWAGAGTVASQQNQTATSAFGNRAISTSFVGSPTDPLYFSALFTKTGGDNTFALWLEISDNAATNDNDARIGLVDSQFSVQMEGIDNTSSNADFGTYTPGEQVLIVGKLEFNVSGANERLQIWVDPTDVETASLVSAQLTGEDLGWVTPTHALTGNFVLGGGVGLIDDIRIGSEWEDVGPFIVAPSAPAPEPSTAILAVLGFVGLLGTRRRRRK